MIQDVDMRRMFQITLRRVQSRQRCVSCSQSDGERSVLVADRFMRGWRVLQ